MPHSWELLRKSSFGTNISPRSGVSGISHKNNKVILFGGVADDECKDSKPSFSAKKGTKPESDEMDENSNSTCYNDTFLFIPSMNKIFPLLKNEQHSNDKNGKNDANAITRPCPRFSSCLAIYKNTLYM